MPNLPTPPYYAAIFSAQLREGSDDYSKTAERMVNLAKTMPGFLGVESARTENGFGITVSYWESEAAIKNWRDNDEHAQARQRGRKEWYADYTIRVARVERSYEMDGTHDGSNNRP